MKEIVLKAKKYQIMQLKMSVAMDVAQLVDNLFRSNKAQGLILRIS